METPNFLSAARCFFLFVLVLGFPVAGQASQEAGVEWLQAQQEANGAFFSSATTAMPFQATAQAVATLKLLDIPDPEGYSLSILYLDSYSSFNAEHIARAALVTEDPARADQLISALLAYKNSDGGISGYESHDSSVLATAFSLLAWSGREYADDQLIGEAIGYLLSTQNDDDGGWAEQPNISSIYVTAWASLALQQYQFTYQIADKIGAASEHLLRSMQSDGGWESNLDSALALSALVPALPDSSRYQPGVSALLAQQQSNGSWNDDVFITAVALSALYLAGEKPAASDLFATLAGTVIDQSSGAPLANASVTLQGAAGITSVYTGVDGRFSFSDLAPQDYVVVFSAPGFDQVTVSLTINSETLYDIGIVPLGVDAGIALLSGQVLDGLTGLPVGGAQVEVSGSSTQTDNEGRYHLIVVPGDTTITVSGEGYVTSSASAIILSASNLVYSFSLYPEGTGPEETLLTMQGIIVDADTGTPLSGVAVDIIGTSISGYTDELGNFSITGNIASESVLSITDNRYLDRTINFYAASGTVDFGVIRLRRDWGSTATLIGVVRDAETGTPIAGAHIKVGVSEAISNEQGMYSLEGLADLSFILEAFLLGYNTSVMTVSLQEYGASQLDIVLQKNETAGVSISDLQATSALLDPYQLAIFDWAVVNSGNADLNVGLIVRVRKADGEIVAQFPLSPSQSEGVELFPIAQGTRLERSFDWFTSNTPPGEYLVHLQAYSIFPTKILDEKEIKVTINPVKHLHSLTVSASPGYQVQGAFENIDVAVSTRSLSNIEAVLSFTLKVLNPDGGVLHTSQHSVMLSPPSIFETFPLTNIPIAFSTPGVYLFEAQSIDGITVDQLVAAPIDVAPDLRIEGELEVSPSQVVPYMDQEIRVRINVEGRESSNE